MIIIKDFFSMSVLLASITLGIWIFLTVGDVSPPWRLMVFPMLLACAYAITNYLFGERS